MLGRRPPPLTRPEVFTAFYREHIEAVLRFVTRRVDDPHVAADITAEVFFAVIKSADSYREDRGSPLAWLYGIARNHIADEARRRARETAGRQRLAGRRLLGDDDIGRLEERIDANQAARALYHRVLRLPEAERAVLELVAVDGLTVTEAAHALHIRSGAARARLFRARRALTDESALVEAP
jgi:RNA polymerase sigma-70 factor (ECF subfamily)